MTQSGIPEPQGITAEGNLSFAPTCVMGGVKFTNYDSGGKYLVSGKTSGYGGCPELLMR